MRSYQDLQEAWLHFAPDSQIDYAAPFLTYVPADFAKQRRRVLYVGKATAGDFNRDSFKAARDGSLLERIAERRRIAQGVFENASRFTPTLQPEIACSLCARLPQDAGTVFTNSLRSLCTAHRFGVR